MERPQHARSASDYQRRTSNSSSTRQTQNKQPGSTPHLPQSSSPVSGAGGIASRRRHVQNLSLPQNRLLALEGTHSRPLSPFEERFLGRGTHAIGIPLAEPAAPSPSVTGKFISSVRRAVSLKKERTPTPEDNSPQFARLSPRPATPLSSKPNISNAKYSRTAPPQSIITAHRSPFGGYTKEGDFVVTRTTDGRRLPVPQPHPHSHSNGRVSLPPPPVHSAMRKNSSVSIESGDSYTLVTTPDSASSVGSVNAGGSVGKGKNVSMLAKLMGKSHGRSLSSTANSSVVDVTRISTRKVVRFTAEPEDTSSHILS